MHRIRTARAATVLALGTTLAACQTSQTASLDPAAETRPAREAVEPALTTAPGRIVAQNKGWVVRAHPAKDGSAAYCLATRQGESLPRLAFRATAEEAGMLVRGAAGSPSGKDGEKLTATFNDGEKMKLDARPLPDGRVLIPVAIPDYYDVLDPFAGARTVTLESESLGKPVADLNLSGSLWAINALDECRILHTED